MKLKIGKEMVYLKNYKSFYNDRFLNDKYRSLIPPPKSGLNLFYGHIDRKKAIQNTEVGVSILQKVHISLKEIEGLLRQFRKVLSNAVVDAYFDQFQLMNDNIHLRDSLLGVLEKTTFRNVPLLNNELKVLTIPIGDNQGYDITLPDLYVGKEHGGCDFSVAWIENLSFSQVEDVTSALFETLEALNYLCGLMQRVECHEQKLVEIGMSLLLKKLQPFSAQNIMDDLDDMAEKLLESFEGKNSEGVQEKVA